METNSNQTMQLSQQMRDMMASLEQHSRALASIGQYLFRLGEQMNGVTAMVDKLARQLPTVHYLGDHLAIARVLDRYRMFVDTRDIGVSSNLMVNGFWEMDITGALQRLIKPGMTVIDVGANIGYFTILAGDLAGPKGKVYGVEPGPRNADLLRRSIEFNGMTNWVHVLEVAAAEQEKTIDLYIDDIYFAGHNLYEQAGREAISVRGATLDSLVEGKVDVMKIDAEGYEPFVLKGLQGIFDRSPEIKIVMEICPWALRAGGNDPAEFLRHLKELGFVYYQLQHDSGIRACEDEDLLNVQHYTTVAMAKRGVALDELEMRP